MHCRDRTDFPRFTTNQLLNFAQQFASLADVYQCKIFYLVIKNHLIGSSNYAWYAKYCALVQQLYSVVNNKQQFLDIIDAFIGKNVATNENLDYFSIFAQHIGCDDGTDLFIKSLKLNTQLFKCNFCPLICYAFGKWQIGSDITTTMFYDILELTVMSVYRVAPHTLPSITGTLLNDAGGIFDIYITPDDKLVTKLPKNYAAFSFLAQQEFDSYKFFAKNAKFSKYLPSVYELDKKTMILTHSFIAGDSGDHMLMHDIHITDAQRADLARFYDIYLNCPEMQFLDIHPGNFIWSERQGQWFFIDMGLIPYIGSDYYKWPCFDDYYHNVWETRLWQMKNIPIRSLDYELSQITPKK